MLRIYSRWTGETLRSVAKLRSSGCPVRGLCGDTRGHRLVAGVQDRCAGGSAGTARGPGPRCRGREAVVQVGGKAAAAIFADDAAVPIGVELVNQHRSKPVRRYLRRGQRLSSSRFAAASTCREKASRIRWTSAGGSVARASSARG